MANYIGNSSKAPELLESSLKTLLIPVANFTGTLLSGGVTTVDIVGPTGTVYGTFVLDTPNVPVPSGLITNLPAQLRFAVTAGTGIFRIEVTPSI